MKRRKKRFTELPGKEDVVKNTYVVALRIRWQGMLSNPLCSFWSQGLSEIWAGAEIETSQKAKTKQIGKFPSETAWLKFMA